MRLQSLQALVYAAGAVGAGPRFTDTARATVFDVDLQAQNLPEENTLAPHEEDPGAFIRLNDDDDDGDGIIDREQMFMSLKPDGTPLDDDLMPMTVALATAGVDGTLTITATPGKVRLWRKDGSALVQVYSGDSWWITTSDPAPTFWVEGIGVSQTLRDVEVTSRFAKAPVPGADVVASEDTVKFTVLHADLDIDSDNNNLFGLPDRSTAEDLSEDVTGDDLRPGKVILVRNFDSDATASLTILTGST